MIVHVLRDPSGNFAAPLEAADAQFALGKPRLANGRPIIVAMNEGDSYTALLRRVGDMRPTLLIIDPRSELPADVAAGVTSLVRGSTAVPVCGVIAYVPTSVAGEERQAVELYLRFLEAHCHPRHGVVTVNWTAELAKARAALRKDPQSAFWHNQAGVAYDALGDFARAVSELKRARALEPTNPHEDYMLYALYKRKGMHRAERGVLLDALEKDPNNPLGRFEFAYLLEQEKDWADSLREYQTTKHLLATVTGSQYVDPMGGSYDVDGIREEVAEAINRVAKQNEAARSQK